MDPWPQRTQVGVSPRSLSTMSRAAGVAAAAALRPLSAPHSPPSSVLEHSVWLAAGRERPELTTMGKVLDDGVLKDLLVQVHGSTGSHHLETRTKNINFRTTNVGLLKDPD
jgi:hypothetical protein